MPNDFSTIYDTAGGGQQIDPLFLQAQTIVESRQNPNARSPKGALGVSQFMPGTASKAGVNGTPIDPLDPQQAIPAQAALMNKLLTQYTSKDGTPDVVTALKEYHGGPDRRIWGPLTAAYPEKVRQVYMQLKSQQTPQTQDDNNTPFDELMRRRDSVGADIGVLRTGNPPTNPPVGADIGGDTPFDRLMATPDAPGAAQPLYSEAGSPAAADMGIPGATPAQAAPAPQRIGSAAVGQYGAMWDAAKRGWQTAPPLLTPAGERLFGLPGYLVNQGANVGLGALNAGYNALQEAAVQTFDPVGRAINGQPGLGRDVATMMDLTPAIQGGLPRNLLKEPTGLPTPKEQLLSPEFKAKPFTDFYNPAAVKVGDTEPTYFTPDKGMTPTADPAASGTRRFAQAIYYGIMTGQSGGGMIIGEQIGRQFGAAGSAMGGALGGVTGAVLAHVTAQYGPAVAKAVLQSAVGLAKSPAGQVGVAGMVNRLQQQPTDSTQ